VSHADFASRPAPPSTWHMYRAMVGIGVLCGLIIVTVFQLTRPIIERNQDEALQKAIFQVLPADESGAFRAFDGDRTGASAQLVYSGYDDAHELVGLAVEAQGMGYQDVIRLIYGYSFAEQAIIGIQVLESKETPGLGDKIETDEDQSAIAHPIVAVRHGEKTHPWEVDGITGATISSKAIAEILERSAQHWVPLIRNNLSDFRNATRP